MRRRSDGTPQNPPLLSWWEEIWERLKEWVSIPPEPVPVPVPVRAPRRRR